MTRWWGLRHLRYWYHLWRCIRYVQACKALGLGLGFINASDEAILDAIWGGRA